MFLKRVPITSSNVQIYIDGPNRRQTKVVRSEENKPCDDKKQSAGILSLVLLEILSSSDWLIATGGEDCAIKVCGLAD